MNFKNKALPHIPGLSDFPALRELFVREWLTAAQTSCGDCTTDPIVEKYKKAVAELQRKKRASYREGVSMYPGLGLVQTRVARKPSRR